MDNDNEQEYKSSLKQFPLRMTDDERAFLRKVARNLDIRESNIVRNGIKLDLQARGIEIPEGYFIDREPGNRTKKDLPASVKRQAGRGSEAVVGVAAPSAAFI